MPLNISGNIINSEIVKRYPTTKISKAGLILHLDAFTPESYPGSGTAWYDLSGNNNTATMFGTVPFLTDTSQCFDFATATGASSGSSTLGFTFASNMISTTGNFTLSTWIKNPNTSAGQVGLFSNAGGADGYRFGIGTNGIYYLIGPTYTEGNLLFSSTLSTSLWYNVSAVFNRSGTSVLLYLNGIFQSSVTIPSQSAMQNGAPGIVRSPCCGIYTGKLSTFMVYNAALSASLLLQNYNIQKGRFGL
jgi:hypothetical protein